MKKIIVITFLFFSSVACAQVSTINDRLNECSKLVEDIQKCQINEDCKIYYGRGCLPCDCYQAYNKNADLSVIDKIRKGLEKDVVCEACFPEDVIAVCKNNMCVKKARIDSQEKQIPIAERVISGTPRCTNDVRECPEGGYVRRHLPSCEFNPCPPPPDFFGGNDCPHDVKQCFDGSYVTRQPPDCELQHCPGKKQITISPEDQTCELGSDCIHIQNSCRASECCQVASLNRDHQEKYSSQIRECRGWRSSVPQKCTGKCIVSPARCIEGRCV